MVALLRLLTIAPDPWEWDEVFLSRAVQSGIDLRAHRPHPPGYPLLVELATSLPGARANPYRALALVGTAGGIAACGALAFLLCVVGLPTGAAAFGGILYALVPSVWLFGVRGYSDAPATAAFLLASALLLRSLKSPDRQSALPGLVLVAVTAGLRPQTAVPLLPLALVATVAGLRRPGSSRRAALGGVLASAFVSALVWLPAVVGSGGFRRFAEQVEIQAGDVRRNAVLPLSRLLSPDVWRRWLLDPFGSAPLFAAVAALALLGAAVARRRALVLFAVFAPWAAVTIPVSHPYAATRYGAPLLAFVCGLVALAVARTGERHRFAGAALAASLLAAEAWIAVGPVTRVASQPSPPVAAISRISRPPFDRGTVVVDPVLRVHAEWLLPGRRVSEIAPDRPVVAAAGDIVVLADRSLLALSDVRTFSFGEPVLGRIGQERLLSVTVGRADRPTSVGLKRARGATPVVRYDEGIPVAVDEPATGAVVSGALVVRGWCQEAGGRAVEPVLFQVDGTVLEVRSLRRVARPDVAAVLRWIGPASRAGYVATLDSAELTPGPHALVVTFRAADGRERVAQPVPFTWAAGIRPPSGPAR